MHFKTLTGLDFNTDFLSRVMDLDKLVYSAEYAGELKNMVARYQANRDSFVCIMDEAQDQLAGYINFFPCTKALYEDILYHTKVIRDDDIRPEEIASYNQEENHLFIISIVVHPDYRSTKEAIIALSDAWIKHLNKQMVQGYPITDISAIAVSKDGKKALRNYLFTVERELSDGNTVYLCKDRFLEKLLNHDLYFKSYRSDIYLLLPLADNVKNHRMDELFEYGRREDIPEIAKSLLDGLENCLKYEMSNAVLEELDIVYLGDFDFLHTTDDYLPDGDEITVGEEKMYAILTAHRPSHMYVLTLFLPDSPFSTTQVQDQLSYGYLKVRNPESADERRYLDIYEYIRLKYGLLKCGSGKSFLCLSGKPDNPREFQNILAGEVYNSMHIDYHIQSKEIEEMCQTNHAQYDYYEVYLSDVVIAFILKEFSKDVHERIELTATYIFIAELVMFQNTSLAKTNIKITNALANDGDISYEQIHELYREFGKTVRFWEIRNFKYNGTQAEAACITKAFSNEELKQTYYEHQEFLEHIVELKTAQTEAVNGTVLNIVATILAVIQIQGFAVEVLSDFYRFMGIEAVYAEKTFTTIIISGTLTILIIYMILRKKKRSLYKHNLTYVKERKKR